MDKDDMKAMEIKGLTNNTVPGSSGWLIFTQSRAGNDKFYRWFVQTVICPFVSDCRTSNEDKVALSSILVFICCIQLLPSLH